MVKMRGAPAAPDKGDQSFTRTRSGVLWEIGERRARRSSRVTGSGQLAGSVGSTGLCFPPLSHAMELNIIWRRCSRNQRRGALVVH